MDRSLLFNFILPVFLKRCFCFLSRNSNKVALIKCCTLADKYFLKLQFYSRLCSFFFFFQLKTCPTWHSCISKEVKFCTLRISIASVLCVLCFLHFSLYSGSVKVASLGEWNCKSLEVYFILTNRGVRRTLNGLFGVDLKSYTILKIMSLPHL